MEILLAIAAVVVIGALFYFNRSAKSLDINNDGKVDAADAKAAVQNAVEGVKATADVNKDGKVDIKDAKTVKEKAVAGAVKNASKAKAAVKKATGSNRGRKPKTK